MNRTYTGLHYDTMCTHFPTDASLFLIFFFCLHVTCHLFGVFFFRHLCFHFIQRCKVKLIHDMSV